MRTNTSAILAIILLLGANFASAAHFNSAKRTSGTGNSLKLVSSNGDTFEYSTKNTNRSLNGTGLAGSVRDCGDHWELSITGGAFYGHIRTGSGLLVSLSGVSTVIGNNENHQAISAAGGLAIEGPGVLHVDQTRNYTALNSSAGAIMIENGAVVGIHNLGNGYGVSVENGLEIVASSLHVQSPDGKGIYCSGDGDNYPSETGLSVNGAILTVLAKGNAVVLRDRAPFDARFSSVHLVSTAEDALYDGDDVIKSGAPIRVKDSLVCAVGGHCGIFNCGHSGSADKWSDYPAALHLDNAIGIFAGGNAGVTGLKWIDISGGATKCVFAGNLKGTYRLNGTANAVEILGGNNSSGNAIHLASAVDSYFDYVQTAGSVKLFAPATKALSRGEVAIKGGSLEVPAKLDINDFRTHYTVAGIAAAAETLAAGSLRDSIAADLALAQSISELWSATEVLFSASGNEKSAVGLACDLLEISGGRVSMDVSVCGIASDAIWLYGGTTSIRCPDGSRACYSQPHMGGGTLAVNGSSPESSAYTVRFDANGGTGSMSDMTVATGANIVLPANRFTKSGFTFLGWSKTRAGPVAYANAAAVKNLAAAGGIVTLYAKWTANAKPADSTKITLKFVPNGGTGTMADCTVTVGKIFYLPANKFTRKGYVFGSWEFSEPNVGAHDKQGLILDSSLGGKTLVLRAQWARPAYKVAYKANGGKLPKGKKMAKQTMSWGKFAKLRKNVFTRKGYVFAGWARNKTNAKTGVISYNNREKVSNLREDGGTQTLYAVWAKPTYTVAFKANGGKGKMTAQKMRYGKSAKLRKNAFKRKGYVFAGWALKKGGAVKYKNRAKVKNLRKDGKVTKFYAVWKKKSAKSVPTGLKEAGKTLPESVADATGSAVGNAAAGIGEVAERVLVTARGGENADAVADGNGTTAWTTDAANGTWVVLTFPEPRDVEDVEVVGETLPEGTRFLISEDADDWREELPGTAQYLWVVFPACDGPLAVKEIRVLPE